MNWINYVWKASLGMLVAAGGALGIAMQDEVITAGEWVTIGVAAIVAFAAVWAVPNMPKGVMWAAKTVTAAVVAFGAGFAQAYPDGITQAEWVTIGVAVVIAAAGVFAAENTPISER